jgi:hypothetical protein
MRRILSVCAFLACLGSTATGAALIQNGSFETGDFTGWTASALPSIYGDVEGALAVLEAGDLAPVGGHFVAPPSHGQYHAVAGLIERAVLSLTQPFFVPSGTIALNLTFDMFVNSLGPGVSGPVSAWDGISAVDLDDPADATPSQGARVDIIAAGADPFTETPLHVVLPQFVDGDKLDDPFEPYKSYAFNLLDFLMPGTEYQLRFVHTSNRNFSNMGVDNVSLTAAIIPLPASAILLSAGIVAFAWTRGRRRPRGLKEAGV